MSSIPNLPESVINIASDDTGGNADAALQQSLPAKEETAYIEDAATTNASPATNGVNGVQATPVWQLLPAKDRAAGIKDAAKTNGSPATDDVGDAKATSPWQLHDAPVENQRPLKVIVIGAGYSGVYQGIRIPERLRNVELVIYEKNAGIGGTWYENRYPGAACDVPSHSYQFSFNPKHDWSSLYAPSWEIRDYLQGTAKKYGADRFIKLEHTVVGADWDAAAGKWKVQVKRPDGQTLTDESDVVISARGNLNTKMWPEVEGLWDFKGEIMHSSEWNDDYDFSGKRIGIIGSGSSAIQIIPKLQAVPNSHLSCFIRNRTWISPPLGQHTADKYGLQGFEFPQEQIEKFKHDPQAWNEFRMDIEADANNIHAVTIKGTPMQKGARTAFVDGMKERLKKKPHYFDWLKPDFSPGCRRLTPGPGFLEALVEDNVAFIRDRISHATATGIVTADGTEHALDVLVCATGFYASTAPPFPVRGLDARTLQHHWAGRATNYLSLATDHFPNYFIMLGPNGAIGEGSLTMMIESTGDYILKAVRKIQKENIRSMAVKPARVRDFLQYVDTYFAGTVYAEECRSWYKKDGRGRSGDLVTGLWPGSTLHCIEALRSPRWEDYEYEYLPGADQNLMGWLGNGWGLRQLENPGRVELSFYITPMFQEREIGVPVEGKPEENPQFNIRPWSY